MRRIAYVDARRILTSAQKPAAGVPAYLRWVNRPLGGRAAIVGAALGWSPNGMTALSATLGAMGIAVLVLAPAWWSGLVAAGLLLAGYILDSADGQLARIQGRGGPAGEWLDHVVDGVRAPLVHLAVMMHLLRHETPFWLVAVAGLFSVLVSGWFLSQLLAEKLLPRTPAAAGAGGSRVWESLVKQPQDPSSTYLTIALISLPAVFAILYTALFAWHVVIFAGSLRRKYRLLTESTHA